MFFFGYPYCLNFYRYKNITNATIEYIFQDGINKNYANNNIIILLRFYEIITCSILVTLK